jgi:hypothetical protein
LLTALQVYDPPVVWTLCRVEGSLRERGMILPTETIVGAYWVEVRSTDGGRTLLGRDTQMASERSRLPLDRPVPLCLTDRKVMVVVPDDRVGWLSDIAAVAAARKIDGRDLDLLLVEEQPRQYRLRCQRRAAAAKAAHQLTDACRERLAGLPEEQRVWWLIQHADALHKVEELQLAADLYRRVAETGVWPHASTAALNYGRFLGQTGSVEQAREYFLRALEAGPDKIAGQAAMLLGLDARKRADDATARDYFARAVALGEPKGAEILALMDQMEQWR